MLRQGVLRVASGQGPSVPQPKGDAKGHQEQAKDNNAPPLPRRREQAPWPSIVHDSQIGPVRKCSGEDKGSAHDKQKKSVPVGPSDPAELNQQPLEEEEDEEGSEHSQEEGSEAPRHRV